MCRKFSFLVSFVLVLGLVTTSWGAVASVDIGPVGIAGSSTDTAGAYTIQGSGHDIWGGNDGFHYVCRPLSGDGTIEARLASMTAVHNWAKVGLMIRETLDDNSKHAMVIVSGANGLQVASRPDTGGATIEDIRVSGYIAPQDLKISRVGDTIKLTYWNVVIPGILEEFATRELYIPMNTDVFIGMAVCSHDNGQLQTASFDGPSAIQIMPPALIPNPGSPVVWPAQTVEAPWLLSPADGAMDVPLDATLSWMPGDSALSTDVYFGTENPPPLVGNKLLGDETYDPGGMAEGTVYYYQLISRPGGEESAVMSFTSYEPPPPPCGIERCVWEGVGGVLVDDLRNNPAYPDSPTWCDQLTSMASYDFADNYGARMQGLLWPETGGEYTFWIAADDGCELWLSTDENPANLTKIAGHNAWTSAHAWFSYPEQQSAPVTLEGGKKYWIQALWKEGGGGDNCQVAWYGPDQPVWPVQGNGSSVISGYYFPLCDPSPTGLLPADGVTLTPDEVAHAGLSFDAKRGATQYDVYFGEEGGSMALIASGMDTAVAAPPVEADKTYNWKVVITYDTEVVESPVQAFSTAEWVSMDIATSGGSATKDGDCWTIAADGADIWGNGDQFHFVYHTPDFTRDTGTVTARVMSVLNVGNTWAKAGVMIRETTASGSKNACTIITPPDGQQRIGQQWRDATNGGSSSLHYQTVHPPEWVRLTREGNVYKGYHSEDGVNWTQITTHTTNMDSFVRVGLCVTSHLSGALTTAQICNYSFSTPDPRQSWGLMPECGATGQSVHATVGWNPGDGVAAQRVYFSTNEDAVANRTVMGADLPADATEYDPSPEKRHSLMLSETYYWAVDSIMPDGTVIAGEVCSFTVEDFRLVDDFESYDIDPEALPDQRLIPGSILVEAVPPPDNTWVEPQVLIEAIDPGTDCLVSQWEFEGDYTDSVGTNHGTPMGDATIVTDAQRGDVLSLDGGGDYVNIDGYKGVVAVGGVQQAFTISNWFKTTGNAEMVTWGTNTGGQRLSWRIDGGRLRTEHGSGNLRGNTYVNDDDWHHGALVVNEGANLRVPNTLLYVDGEQDSTFSGSDNTYNLTAGADVSIGRRATHNDRFFNGQLDDVRIYDCALTKENIRFLAGKGNVVKPGYYGPTIVHWAMDDGSGNIATDDSGNDLHGAVNGAVWDAVTADGSTSCLDFGGAGDYVVNEDAAPYLNNLGALTISLWIKSDVIDTDKGFIIGRDPEGNDQRGIRYDTSGAGGGGDDVIKYGVATNQGAEESESSEMLQTTDWQHVMLTWESGVGTTLYINGEYDTPTDDKPAFGGLTSGYTKLLVGKGGKDGAADAGWDGKIDDVWILDRVATEGERRYFAGMGNLTLPDSYFPMIAEYLIETDASDTSGNNNHAIALHGDATIVADPERGAVGAFDGDGDAVDVGNSELFNFLDDCTISVWVNLNSWGGGWGNCIVGKRGEGGVGWQLRRFGNEPRFSWTTRGMGNDDYPRSDQNIAMGQWYHLGAVRDGTQKRLYIDGKLENTQGINANRINPCVESVYVGARSAAGNAPEAFFDGKIDELRIYNEALNIGQIRTLANYVSTPSISDTWSGRGATSPKLDYNNSHGGSQSMRVEYTGDGAVTRLEPFRDGADPQVPSGDWTLAGAKALVMYFKGDPDNAPGKMFAQLQTTVSSQNTQRVVYNGDPEDLQSEEWIEWNLELHDLFTGKPQDPPLPDEGIPGTKIKSVGVGIIGGGSGTLYFDDIGVYPTRCVPMYGPENDLNDDCRVDEGDLQILVGDWLLGDKTESDLLLKLDFEDDLSDSSGNVGDGTAHGAVGFEDDATRGKVLDLPGGDDQYVSIPPVGNSGNQAVSIACWAKADVPSSAIPDWTLVFGFTGNAGGGGGSGSHFNIGNIGGPGGIGAHVWGWEATIFSDAETEEWRHYAMTYDGALCTYYGDGVIKGTRNFPLQHGWNLSPRADRVHVGSRITQASSFPGNVDDARIYSRELSTAEVNLVMSGGEVPIIYTPLVSIANLYDEEPVNSKKVNFNDYAVLMADWLEEKLWP